MVPWPVTDHHERRRATEGATLSRSANGQSTPMGQPPEAREAAPMQHGTVETDIGTGVTDVVSVTPVLVSP